MDEKMIGYIGGVISVSIFYALFRCYRSGFIMDKKPIEGE